LQCWIDFPYWFLFLIAGIASAWIGGRVAGWTAVVLSTLACDYFFNRPYYSFAIDPDELPQFIAFAISMLVGNWFGNWRKNADTAIRQDRDQLASRVRAGGIELEKVNEALRTEVTNREQAEHERRIAELRWQAVFDSSVIGMALADEQGRIIATNDRFSKLTGADISERKREELGAYIATSLRAEFNIRFQELIDGRRQRIELEQQHPTVSGGSIWVRIHIEMVAGTTDFARFVITFCEDITEHKGAAEALITARAQLAHASRLTILGELTASIAHEVNQPLAAIVTNSNACLRWLGGDQPNLAEANNTLNWIMRDAKRASDVVARIRSMMRKGETRFAPLNCNDIVHEGLNLTHREIQRQRIEVTTDLDSELPVVQGERVQLQQVVLNLIINAIEAMATIHNRPRKLTITSRAWSKDGSGIVIEIGDTGPGVKQADFEKLFNPFFTTKTEGTGLGLWICRSIIENHAGELLPVVNAVDGMTFRIILPCEPPHARDNSLVAGEDFY